MEKFYRVKKDTFLWKKGAILSSSLRSGGYLPIEDIWNVTEDQSEYISTKLIEAPENSEWFERVYRNSITGKIFMTAEKLAEAYKGSFE